MKRYIEITLIPSAEINLYFLWQKVYKKIHLGFVEIQDPKGNIPVGVSFPQYNIEFHRLGCKLRLFSEDEEILERLDVAKWLNRLTDYVDVTQICNVPQNITQYANFRRQQVKSGKERIARRKAKREGITVEQALEKLQGVDEQRVETPFINMKSQSSDKQFRLFIEKVPTDNFKLGMFNTYGLSKISTVPDF